MIANGEHQQKKYGKWRIVCLKFIRCSKNGTIAKILESMKKQKLLNEENINNIKVTPDSNKSRNTQEQSIGRSNMKVIKLCLCPKLTDFAQFFYLKKL